MATDFQHLLRSLQASRRQPPPACCSLSFLNRPVFGGVQAFSSVSTTGELSKRPVWTVCVEKHVQPPPSWMVVGPLKKTSTANLITEGDRR